MWETHFLFNFSINLNLLKHELLLIFKSYQLKKKKLPVEPSFDILYDLGWIDSSVNSQTEP